MAAPQVVGAHAAGDDGGDAQHPASTSAWVVAGIASPVANSDMTPINAPGGQYRTVIVRPSGAVTYTRTTPEMTTSGCGSGSPSQWVTEPAATCVLADPTSWVPERLGRQPAQV